MSKMRDTKNNRKEDGKFKKMHINHNPQYESTRATFGEPKAHDDSEGTDVKL